MYNHHLVPQLICVSFYLLLGFAVVFYTSICILETGCVHIQVVVKYRNMTAAALGKVKDP